MRFNYFHLDGSFLMLVEKAADVLSQAYFLNIVFYEQTQLNPWEIWDYFSFTYYCICPCLAEKKFNAIIYVFVEKKYTSGILHEK